MRRLTWARGLRGMGTVCILCALSGCGGGQTDELPRQAVSGKVSLDGKPLARGQIEFQPSAGSAGTPAAGEIADGAFSIPRAEGPTPGSYTVSITAAPKDAGTAGAMPGDTPPPPKEPIPPKYNAQTTLKADVTKDGPNSFPFELQSK